MTPKTDRRPVNLASDDVALIEKLQPVLRRRFGIDFTMVAVIRHALDVLAKREKVK